MSFLVLVQNLDTVEAIPAGAVVIVEQQILMAGNCFFPKLKM